MMIFTIRGIEYANEFAHVFAKFVASSHVLHIVSDSLEVKYEFGRPLSFILEQVFEPWRQASSGIDLEIRSELYCV